MACQTPNPVAETHLQTPSPFEIVNLTSSLSSPPPALPLQRRFGAEFNQKEQEIRTLRKQLAQVEADLRKPTEAPVSYSPFSTLMAHNPFLPTPEPAYSPFGPFNYSYEPPSTTYHPSPLFRPTPTPTRYEPKSPSSSEESHPPKRKIDKGKDKMYLDLPPQHMVSIPSEPDDDSSDNSSDDSEDGQMDITTLLMADPQPTTSQTGPSPTTDSTSGTTGPPTGPPQTQDPHVEMPEDDPILDFNLPGAPHQSRPNSGPWFTRRHSSLKIERSSRRI
ncbi:extensin-like [Hevea brasiliensis]|uniref:extensin-like n=1 Tax=Hevea brasiliensis TaxID=3981 RepID=UPI0025E53970|nr:extensin-like [Hevea brasiliensis]